MPKKKKLTAKNQLKKTSTSSEKKETKLWRWGILSVLLLVTLFAYQSINDAELLNWDDPDYVIDNSIIKDFNASNIKHAFLSGVHSDYPDGIASNYHPLTIVSLMANHSMTGLSAPGFLWTNLLLHLLNVLLCFFLFKKIFPSKLKWLPVLGAAIFALHPMHVESVAWVSERKDVLYVLFYQLGMLQYLKYRTNKGLGIVLVYLFFIFSLWSKPSAVTFPVALLLLEWLKQKEWQWKSIIPILPMFLISILFGIITLSIQAGVAVGDLEKYSIIEKLGFGSFGILYYLFMFLIPTSTAAFYPYPSVDHIPLFIKISPFILLGLSLLIGKFFRSNKIVLFAILFYLLNLILTLQFVQVGPSLVSDRYTYISYHGLILLLLLVLKFVWEKYSGKDIVKYGSISLVALYLIFLVFRTPQQVASWKNSGTLWNQVLDLFPGSSYAYKGLGDYYYRQDEFEKALPYLDKAHKVYAKEPQLLNIKANTLKGLGKHKDAIPLYTSAISLNPNNPNFYNNRANSYLRTGQMEKAKHDYEKCLELNPQHKSALINFGSYLYEKGEYENAIKQFDSVLESHPNEWAILLNRAGVYLTMGKNENCIRDIDNYLKNIPDSDVAYYYKAMALQALNKKDEALTIIEKAISLNTQKQEYLILKNEIFRMK